MSYPSRMTAPEVMVNPNEETIEELKLRAQEERACKAIKTEALISTVKELLDNVDQAPDKLFIGSKDVFSNLRKCYEEVKK
jgi:hypothetical protein